MKKLLLLGGSAQQIVAIETAKKMGYYTILCDYLEDNPGQNVADKFYLESTTDKEKILEISQKEKIDGILAYASDPAAPTAAYVAEKMNLSTNPYKSVETLCNKDKFREFLIKNGFNAPKAKGFNSKNDIKKKIDDFEFPIIIKPVDSSGSKGVTVLYSEQQLEEAVDNALSYSRNKRIIIEEYIEKKHSYLVGGDIFICDGKIVLWGLLNCHRDNRVNALVPVGKSYPVQLAETDLLQVKATLQRMVEKLHIKAGAMNVELVIDEKNRVFLLDVGPRNGGNMIPDLLSYIFNIDIVELSIKAAMGDTIVINNLQDNKYYATHNIHAAENGILEKIYFSEQIKPYIVKKCIYRQYGEQIEYFDNASKALGVVFFKFDDQEQMRNMLENIRENVIVKIEKKG